MLWHHWRSKIDYITDKTKQDHKKKKQKKKSYRNNPKLHAILPPVTMAAGRHERTR